MESDYDIVILGDICLDWYCSDVLSFPFSTLSRGKDLWLTIKELPGGSGLLFAEFAREIGYKPFLLGKIGKDIAGAYIYEWLENRGLNTGVTVAPGKNTGRVFIVNDSDGKRFLLAANESADRWLSASDIKDRVDIISGARLLYVSGHCFKEPNSPRIEAARVAMEIANQSGSSVAFDLVPHEFYKIYPMLSQFKSLTKGVDILISEASTIRRILGMGEKKEKATRPMIEDTLEKVSEHFENVILRYGPHGADFQVIWKRSNGRIIWEETGYNEAPDKRGYGDRLTLRILHDIWKI
jgi:sugar/nucleoside kinase (ribokinase family)